MLGWAELAHPPLGTAGDESETLSARSRTKGASGVAGTEFFQLTVSGTASTSTASATGTDRQGHRRNCAGPEGEQPSLHSHRQHILNKIFARQQQTACCGTLAASPGGSMSQQQLGAAGWSMCTATHWHGNFGPEMVMACIPPRIVSASQSAGRQVAGTCTCRRCRRDCTCIDYHPDGAQVDNNGLFPDEYGCWIWRGNLQIGSSRLGG